MELKLDEQDEFLQLKVEVPNYQFLLMDEGVQWGFNDMTWQQLNPTLPTPYQILLRQAVKIPKVAMQTFRERELQSLNSLFGSDYSSTFIYGEKNCNARN